MRMGLASLPAVLIFAGIISPATLHELGDVETLLKPFSLRCFLKPSPLHWRDQDELATMVLLSQVTRLLFDLPSTERRERVRLREQWRLFPHLSSLKGARFPHLPSLPAKKSAFVLFIYGTQPSLIGHMAFLPILLLLAKVLLLEPKIFQKLLVVFLGALTPQGDVQFNRSQVATTGARGTPAA